jgi:hypothetical protein
LLGMKIWSLTFEKAEELRQQLDERTVELRALENTEPSEIWLNDLEEIEIALGERDDGIRADANAESKAQKKNQKHQQKKKAAAKRGKKKASEWESDMEDSDQDNDSYMSDQEVVKKTTSSRRKPTACKPAAKPTKPAATKSKPAATTKAKSTAAAKPKSTAAAKVKVASAPAAEKEPEVDVINLTLAERMARKLMVSPPAKKATKPAPIDMEIAAQPTFSDEEDAGSFSSGSRKRPSPRNEDSDSDIEVMEAPKPKAKRAKASTSRATKKKVGPKKKSPEPEDSEDEFGFSSEDEDVVVVEKPAARRVGGRARKPTKKPASYVFDADSDSEFSFSD